MKNPIAVLWRQGPVAGRVEVSQGPLPRLRVPKGSGQAKGPAFTLPAKAAQRLQVAFGGPAETAGDLPALVTIRTGANTFSFFLRDVNARTPIFIPEYGVAVTAANDPRTYAQIAASVEAKKLRSPLQRIEAAPEETFEAAARNNRDMPCPTWLGLGRDMRIFRLGYQPEFGYWGYLEPCWHSKRATVPETDHKPYTLHFCIGPGTSCRIRNLRRLEDGVLPILQAVQEEGEVSYRLTAFATLETQPLGEDKVRGTAWLPAYAHTGGQMLRPEEQAQLQGLLEAETAGREEEVVCCIRVEAVNHGAVPRYAWFKGLHGIKTGVPHPQQSFPVSGAGRVFGVSRLNGKPLESLETAVLLQPGKSAVLELLIPHQPLPAKRAARLARLDFDLHLKACRRYWRAKLDSGAEIRVPEPAVDERIRAGLLHCDLVALGREPDGNVLATIGWYAPIGSESAPIIQFFDSMGWHKLAERSLNFFLDRQREDGFIQNFGGYQLETGPVLWTMGEHFRYTRDTEWVRRAKPRILKACEYLLRWRDRNKRDELRGKGYGLLDGKVADPEDFFHSFMLSGLSYLGLHRAAEMLDEIDPDRSQHLAREAEAFRQDIRTSFREALASAPVIPSGDGTWVPSAPPWAEYRGPVALYAEGGNWFTHGAFGARDSLIGALWLPLSEVFGPEERETEFLLKSHQELFTLENAGLSQPYYCRHDFIHLKRGEVKAFLKTYYNQFTALQDRQTYTFWEHYHHASQHKTHEEGWFLMQTRWMLWIEEDRRLAFLRAIPRRWLEDGRRIALRDVATYFGPASLTVESALAKGVVTAKVRCTGPRAPQAVTVRIPHPKGWKALAVEGGRYDPASESVTIAPFNGRARILLRFPT